MHAHSRSRPAGLAWSRDSCLPALFAPLIRTATSTSSMLARRASTRPPSVFSSLVAVAGGWWPILALLAAQHRLKLGRRWCLACVAPFELVQPRFGEAQSRIPVRLASPTRSASWCSRPPAGQGLRDHTPLTDTLRSAQWSSWRPAWAETNASVAGEECLVRFATGAPLDRRATAPDRSFSPSPSVRATLTN